jgi:hypothetical protein
MLELCEKLNNELALVRSLKDDFDLELQRSLQSGESTFLKYTYEELEKKVFDLEKEILVEAEIKLREQYERQVHILKSSNLIKKLSTGEYGIKIGEDEHPVPSYQEVRARLESKLDLVRLRYEQVFDKILLVPFGLKLSELCQIYKDTILKHKDNLKESIEVKEDDPLLVSDEYKEEKLVYFPQEFSKNHGGKNKEDLEPWQILFTIDNAIHRKGEGLKIGGRMELEAGKKAEEYLSLLKIDPQYQGESGFTPEDWLVYAITRLEEDSTVIEAYENGRDSISFNMGAYLKNPSAVPCALWDLGERGAFLSVILPDSHREDIGCRTAVRL